MPLIVTKICSFLELIRVTFSNFLIKLRHAPLAIKRGIYRLRSWWIFSVLFVVVQFAGMHRNQSTNRPEEREELTHSAWESVVCGSQWDCFEYQIVTMWPDYQFT